MSGRHFAGPIVAVQLSVHKPAYVETFSRTEKETLEVGESVTNYAVSEELAVFPHLKSLAAVAQALPASGPMHSALSKMSDCIGEPVPDGEDVVADVLTRRGGGRCAIRRMLQM
jgi:hypothetical protein